MEKIIITATSSFNHLFLKHAQQDSGVFGNVVLETEISVFMESCLDYALSIKKCTEKQYVSSVFEHVICTDLIEGCYFDDMSIDGLKSKVEESFKIIMGKPYTRFTNVYFSYIDKAYQLYKETNIGVTS